MDLVESSAFAPAEGERMTTVTLLILVESGMFTPPPRRL
jgi:hypothetical protein